VKQEESGSVKTKGVKTDQYQIPPPLDGNNYSYWFTGNPGQYGHEGSQKFIACRVADASSSLSFSVYWGNLPALTKLFTWLAF
jgi:hypothetical protein